MAELETPPIPNELPNPALHEIELENGLSVIPHEVQEHGGHEFLLWDGHDVLGGLALFPTEGKSSARIAYWPEDSRHLQVVLDSLRDVAFNKLGIDRLVAEVETDSDFSYAYQNTLENDGFRHCDTSHAQGIETYEQVKASIDENGERHPAFRFLPVRVDVEHLGFHDPPLGYEDYR